MKQLIIFVLALNIITNSQANTDNFAVAAFSSGAKAYNSGDYKTAIIAYSNAVKLEPEFLQAWINLADSYLANLEYQNAFDSINKAVLLNNKNSEAFRIKGMIYLAQKRYIEAIEAFNSALENAEPNFSAIYHSRGHALASLGELDKAIIDTKKALVYAPLDADLYCNLTIFYARKNDYNNTVRYLSIARKIDPKHPKANKLYNDFVNAEKDSKKRSNK